MFMNNFAVLQDSNLLAFRHESTTEIRAVVLKVLAKQLIVVRLEEMAILDLPPCRGSRVFSCSCGSCGSCCSSPQLLRGIFVSLEIVPALCQRPRRRLHWKRTCGDGPVFLFSQKLITHVVVYVIHKMSNPITLRQKC
jgi:hypothetical protein